MPAASWNSEFQVPAVSLGQQVCSQCPCEYLAWHFGSGQRQCSPKTPSHHTWLWSARGNCGGRFRCLSPSESRELVSPAFVCLEMKEGEVFLFQVWWEDFYVWWVSSQVGWDAQPHPLLGASTIRSWQQTCFTKIITFSVIPIIKTGASTGVFSIYTESPGVSQQSLLIQCFWENFIRKTDWTLLRFC